MPTPLVNLEITDTFTTWKNKINDIVATVNNIQTDGLPQLATERSIDGIDFNGTQNVIRYASCSTAAGTRAKTVSIPNFSLITGSYIIIRFANTNTASNPTLNVSGTGAKNIRWNGSNVGSGYIRANRLYAMVYTGSVYEILGDITQACIQQNGGLAVNSNGQLYVNFDLIPEDQMQQIVLNMVQEGGGLSVDNSGKLYVDFENMPTDKFETMLRSIRVPIWLTANKNFYVNGSTGSDTLDAGRGESSSKPFKTIQACINYVTDNYNIGNYVATIYCADVYTTEQIILPEYNRTNGYIQITRWSISESEYGVTSYYAPTDTSYAISCSGGVWRLNYFDVTASTENYVSGSSHFVAFSTNGLSSYVYLNNTCKFTINSAKQTTAAGTHAIYCERGCIIINTAIEIIGIINDGVTNSVRAISVGNYAQVQYANGAINLKISGKFTRLVDVSGRFSVNGVFRDDINTNELTECEYKYYVQNGGAINTGGKGEDYFGTIGEGYVQTETYSWYR